MAFTPHYGVCSNPDCNQDNPLIVVKRGLCQFCNHKEKQAKKKASGKKTGGYTYIKEPTGEGELFREIMDEFGDDPIRCFVCGKRITLLMPHNFMHVLPKGKYASFRLYKPNVVIGCFSVIADENGNQGCHYDYDFKPRSSLKGEGWEKLFKLEEELKTKYREGGY